MEHFIYLLEYDRAQLFCGRKHTEKRRIRPKQKTNKLNWVQNFNLVLFPITENREDKENFMESVVVPCRCMFLHGLNSYCFLISNRPAWIAELKRICIIQMYICIFNKYLLWKKNLCLFFMFIRKQDIVRSRWSYPGHYCYIHQHC